MEAACLSISKDLLEKFNFALVWGTSTKYNPQRVGLSHVLEDEDVLQVVAKTELQQRQSKNYQKKVLDFMFTLDYETSFFHFFPFKMCHRF